MLSRVVHWFKLQEFCKLIFRELLENNNRDILRIKSRVKYPGAFHEINTLGNHEKLIAIAIWLHFSRVQHEI